MTANSLRRTGPGTTARYRLSWADCIVALCCDDPDFVGFVERYLGFSAVPEAGDAASFAIDVVRDGAGFRVRLPDGEAKAASWFDTAYTILEAVAHGFATATRRLVVHAGGFVHDGRAIVYVGESFTGKTSLSFAAWRRGLEVLGDDRVCLDPATNRAMAFPKCLKLRVDPDATPADAAPMLADGSAFIGAMGDDHRLVLSRRLPGFAAYDAMPPIGAVVQIGRTAEDRTVLDDVRAVDVLDRLLAQTSLAEFSPMDFVGLLKAQASRGRLPRVTIAPGGVETALDLLCGM